MDIGIPTEIREVYHTDRLAVARNMATNGRLFCVMQFIACLVVYVVTRNPSFAALAMLAALPVSISVIIDPIRNHLLKAGLSGASHGVAVLVFVVFIIKLG